MSDDLLEPDAPPRRAGRRPSTSHAVLERVALGLFLAKGFDETSVDDIADAAGIGRRTFFRYYPSKADLVWGDFEGELQSLRDWFAACDDEVPLMVAIRRAVIDFNHIEDDQELAHRQRMTLILRVPTLLANSTLRYVQWRRVIAEFAAERLQLAVDDLLPEVISQCALGASIAAYELWLRDDASDLAELLDLAFAELAIGFQHHGNDHDVAG